LAALGDISHPRNRNGGGWKRRSGARERFDGPQQALATGGRAGATKVWDDVAGTRDVLGVGADPRASMELER
jgi:hypothetical protein